MKFKGLSIRHPVKRQEKEPFQDKEQNVQNLSVTKNVPQMHTGGCRDEPGKLARTDREEQPLEEMLSSSWESTVLSKEWPTNICIWIHGRHNMGKNERVTMEDVEHWGGYPGSACEGWWTGMVEEEEEE